MDLLSALKTRKANRDKCPCCDNYTLKEIGREGTCPVCFWSDAQGATDVSLNQARNNYRLFGASEDRFLTDVRKPLDSEKVPHLTKGWYIVPSILLLAGIIASFFGGNFVNSSLSFPRNAESTYGTTISERWVHDWPEVLVDEYYTRLVTIEFRTLDSGHVIRFEVATDRLRVDESVDVLYDPSNPNRAEISRWYPHLVPSLGLLILGIGCLIWGILWQVN
jgi:hypothetical protein